MNAVIQTVCGYNPKIICDLCHVKGEDSDLCHGEGEVFFFLRQNSKEKDEDKITVCNNCLYNSVKNETQTKKRHMRLEVDGKIVFVKDVVKIIFPAKEPNEEIHIIATTDDDKVGVELVTYYQDETTADKSWVFTTKEIENFLNQTNP